MRKRKTISQKVYSTGGPLASLYEENRRLEGKLRAIGAYDDELPKRNFCFFMGIYLKEVTTEEGNILGNVMQLTLPEAEKLAKEKNRELKLIK